MSLPEEPVQEERVHGSAAVAGRVQIRGTVELWRIMFVFRDIVHLCDVIEIVCIVTLLGNLLWGLLMMSEAVPHQPLWAQRTAPMCTTHFECVCMFPTARASDLDVVQPQMS